MKSRKLKPFTAVTPPPPVCFACQAFAPECEIPHGKGVLLACWLCAHHIVDHHVKPVDAPTAECECLPEAIYPESLLEARRTAR